MNVLCLEDKVYGTLIRYICFWEEIAAFSYAVSVIRNGYIPSLRETPLDYEELNNLYYVKERTWSNKAVEKLRKAKIVKKFSREKFCCVSVLTVVIGFIKVCQWCNQKLLSLKSDQQWLHCWW